MIWGNWIWRRRGMNNMNDENGIQSSVDDIPPARGSEISLVGRQMTVGTTVLVCGCRFMMVDDMDSVFHPSLYAYKMISYT
jgi:hypothetical protein